MIMEQYMDPIEQRILQFSYQLINDIKYKVKKNTFYYQNQIEKYMINRIQSFLSNLKLKPALENVYYHQLLHFVRKKLSFSLQNIRLFECLN